MKRIIAILIFVAACSAGFCQSPHKDSTVTNFFRRSSGHIASDAGFTIPLSDGRTMWLMGDSHIDDYDPGTGTVPCLFQVRNAALVQPSHDWDWRHTATLIGNGPGIRSFLKNNPDDEHFIWPGVGIQIKDTVYIYCSSMKNAKSELEGFGFAHAGNDFFAKVHFPDLKVVGYGALQGFDEIGFGIGFIRQGRWVYVYGQKFVKLRNELFVARFSDSRPCGPWEFWGGAGWTADIGKIVPVARQDGVSGTFQVCLVRGRVLLVSSALSMGCDQGKDIYASSSGSLTGPFSVPQRIYTIDDTLQGHYPFFYAAVAHPEFPYLRQGLLFTYAINGYGTCVPVCNDGRMNPDYYRLKAFSLSVDSLPGFGGRP